VMEVLSSMNTKPNKAKKATPKKEVVKDVQEIETEE